MDAAAAKGRLALQHCAACDATQYPPRDLCTVCLSADLDWKVTDHAEGAVLAVTPIHHTNEPSFQPDIPLRIGLIALDAGPTAICFAPNAAPGSRVKIRAALDEQGRAVMTAEISP
jgi:uncharacterized OB-fold protein